ncbi:MAG: BlaI/MecI/CopY family transcriptional regulator [Bacteroidota bacterium]
MKKSKVYQPSEVELEILQILWEKQPASVRLVYESILENREVGYTTILTFMQRMTKKGILVRTKKGKTHFYKAVPKEKEVQDTFFNKLLKNVYKGSSMKLMIHALGQDHGQITEADLDELQRLIEVKKKQSNL